MFEIDFAGLAELEGGKAPEQLAYEPVANVFDEYEGYVEGRPRPTYCKVTIARVLDKREHLFIVEDDGPGFAKDSDIWTLFGRTEKREQAHIRGRFNSGDKQLIAIARRAEVHDGYRCTSFENGNRQRKAVPPHQGVRLSLWMKWTLDEAEKVGLALKLLLPPAGLEYTVNGQAIKLPVMICEIAATLPTVLLSEGVLRPTTRKTTVRVYREESPRLYELGIPVCSLEEVGFPHSLDVRQKIPVPPSRDVVSPAYLYRVIGSTLEQATMDGHTLLSEEQQNAGFLRDALEYVKEPDALQLVIKDLYGDNVVRQSSDPIANSKAAAAGATLIPGRWFGESTRKILDQGILPTSHQKFGGAESIPGFTPEVSESICRACGGTGRV